MFETLLRLYLTNKLTEFELDVAVSMKWISEVQKQEITTHKMSS